MTKNVFKKPFYLIAKYWLGNLEGFVTVGDNKEEIIKLFEERYNKGSFGITEESYQLLECIAIEVDLKGSDS